MKKAIIYGMSLALILSMTACGGSNENAADKSQDTSTPAVTEPVDASKQTEEMEETTPDTAETTPVSQEETQLTAQSQEETPVSEEVGPKFTEVNETVYATTSVNVRSSYSADSDKVGSLSSGASATRTGVGDNGWSRIVYGDSVAYVSSDYLTTTKPSTNTSKPSSGTNTSKPSSNSGSTQTIKPSTNTSKPSTNTSKPSTNTSKPSTNTSKPSTNTGSTQTSKPSTGSSSSSSGTSSGGTSSGGTQGGSNQMTPEEFQEWAKQWGGVGTSSENHVDPGDPGYRDWITGQLNG